MKRIVSLSDYVISPLALGSEENAERILCGESLLRDSRGCFGVYMPFWASLLDREMILAEASSEGIYEGTFFERLAILCAKKAVEKSGIDPSDGKVYFILSSIKGNVELIGKQDENLPLSRSAALLGRFFRNPNPVLTVSNACTSGLCALIQGRRMLLGQENPAKAVVVVGAEVQSRFISSGFGCLKALSPAPCAPFDRDRDGLNLGEGAAAMVISLKDEEDILEGDLVLGEGAIRNDANHISGPSRTAEGSYNALRHVLEGVSKEDIAEVSCHGTATLYNDEMEAIALSRAELVDIPVTSLKGYFGHSMGAAGLLETILTFHCLRKGVIPGTRGFKNLGVSADLDVSESKRPTSKRTFVKLLSGFGGINAAMTLSVGRPYWEEKRHGLPDLGIVSWVRITGEGATLDGKRLPLETKGGDLVTEIYRRYIGNYPKFFKMDCLCRCGVAAAHLLLGQEREAAQPPSPREDTAVLVFTATGPLHNDIQYGKTIQEEAFFPSPSLFVYTLSNIVTGEIAIKEKFRGESSSFYLEVFDEERIFSTMREAFGDSTLRRAVCGWVECPDPDSPDVCLMLVAKGEGGIPLSPKSLRDLYSERIG